MSLVTLRFLNGDTVISKMSPNPGVVEICKCVCEYISNISNISNISTEPIHPLQVCLVGCEEKDMEVGKEVEEKEKTHVYNVLILPKKRVVLAEYGHVISDWDKINDNLKTYLYYHLHSIFVMSVMNNGSILRYILTTWSGTDIPNTIYQNPHPVVTDHIFQSGLLRGAEDVDRLVEMVLKQKEKTYPERHARAVALHILSNPADCIVDRLMASQAFTTAPSRLVMSNPSRRIAEMIFQRYIQRVESVGMDFETQELLSIIIEHPGSTEEIMERVVNDLPPDTLIRKLLIRNLSHFNSKAWPLLYRKWIALPPLEGDDIYTPYRDIDMTNLIHEKRYGELIGKYGKGKTSDTLFDFLRNVSDSDEVADWLLSVASSQIKFGLPSNPHPRVVEWALSDTSTWPDAFFSNPHPRAVQKTVEWWLSNASDRLPGTVDAMHEILSQVRDTNGTYVNTVDIRSLLSILSQTDTEIVFP